MRFNESHFQVIQALFSSPDGFLINYPETDIHYQRWVLVEFPEAGYSTCMPTTACDELLSCGLLVPKIADKEFEIQRVLGTHNFGRTYVLVKEFLDIVQYAQLGM